MSLDLILSPLRRPPDQLFVIAALTGRPTYVIILGFKQQVGPRVVSSELGDAVEP